MTITLATLPDATPQEVFDQVARHLLTQRQKSMSARSLACAYRGPKGLKCAAGCLIGDQEYAPRMEGKGWMALVGRGLVPDAHKDLIHDLQGIHDVTPVNQWAADLRRLGYQVYALSVAVVDELTVAGEPA